VRQALPPVDVPRQATQTVLAFTNS
jgi:hypothetical protein